MYINSYQVEQNATTWRQEQQAQAAHLRLIDRLRGQHTSAPARPRLLLERLRQLVRRPATPPAPATG